MNEAEQKLKTFLFTRTFGYTMLSYPHHIPLLVKNYLFIEYATTEHTIYRIFTDRKK